MWASYLSALLKGRALEVFVRLSRDDQSDYGQIKEALLTNFDLTERSFRKKWGTTAIQSYRSNRFDYFPCPLGGVTIE